MSESPIARMQRRMVEVMEQELSRWMQDLLKDAFSPEKMMRFIRSMGIDISKFPGMVGQQPGFDPYRVLGLDKSASDDEVKKRYRELLYRLHPDTAGFEGTSFLLQMVLAAYEMIKMQRGWS